MDVDKDQRALQTHISLHKGKYPSVVAVYVHAKDLEYTDFLIIFDLRIYFAHFMNSVKLLIISPWARLSMHANNLFLP